MLSGALFAFIGLCILMLIIWTVQRDGKDEESIHTGVFGMKDRRQAEDTED